MHDPCMLNNQYLSMQFDVHANRADKWNPQAEQTMAVILRVLDANDNKPVFTQDPYVAEVAEAAAIGNATQRKSKPLL